MAAKIRLQGVAVVTGAASGIGRETAFAFANAGCEGVVFADINEDDAQASAHESRLFAKHPSYRHLAMKVDVSDPGSVDNLFRETLKIFPRIDYGVNSAGIGNGGHSATPDIDPDSFDRTLAVNAKGTMLFNRALTRVMMKQDERFHDGRQGRRSLGRGSIVNVGSVSSHVAPPGRMSYSASKFAVIAITKTVANDNMKYNIRANAICPGYVDTPLLQSTVAQSPHLGPRIERISPFGRMATVEEAADLILYLSSPGASYINGQSIIMDGGLSLKLHL